MTIESHQISTGSSFPTPTNGAGKVAQILMSNPRNDPTVSNGSVVVLDYSAPATPNIYAVPAGPLDYNGIDPTTFSVGGTSTQITATYLIIS